MNRASDALEAAVQAAQPWPWGDWADVAGLAVSLMGVLWFLAL